MNTITAISRAVLRHPIRPTGSTRSQGAAGIHVRRRTSGSVVHAMAGTMVMAPTPIPTMTSPMARARCLINQWFINVINGTQPPRPCPMERRTKASKNHQKFWVKAKIRRLRRGPAGRSSPYGGRRIDRPGSPPGRRKARPQLESWSGRDPTGSGTSAGRRTRWRPPKPCWRETRGRR